MTNDDHEGRIFLSHPHTNNRLFFLLNIRYMYFIFCILKKDFQRFLYTLLCKITLLHHFNLTITSHSFDVRLFDFYLSLGLSHTGKNSGNSDQVCKNVTMLYANNKSADQPGHLHSLIRACVIHLLDSLAGTTVVQLVVVTLALATCEFTLYNLETTN